MAVNFSKIQNVIANTALPTLGENQSVVLKKPSSTLIDASNPQDGPSTTPITYTVKAVVTPNRKRNRGDGDGVSRGDIKVLIAGTLAEEPAVGWLVVVQGIEYRVSKIATARPGSTTLLYTMECSR